MPGYQAYPFNQESAPTTRERKQHGGSREFTVKLELLPMGPLLMPAHREGNSPGQGVLLGVLGGYSPDAGPWVLLPWKRSSDGIFLEKHLSDVTWSRQQFLPC